MALHWPYADFLESKNRPGGIDARAKVQSGNAEEGFFGEVGSDAADLPNGYSQTAAHLSEGASKQAAGEDLDGGWVAETSEGFEAGHTEDDADGQEQPQAGAVGELEGEQTYGGGYTHQQVVPEPLPAWL